MRTNVRTRSTVIAVLGWWLCFGVLWSTDVYSLPVWLSGVLLVVPWGLAAGASRLATVAGGDVELDLTKIALQGGLTSTHFEDGEEVVRQGDEAEHFYIITRGRARVLIDDPDQGVPIDAGELVEGQFFGEVGLLSGGTRTASVVAAGSLDVLTIDRSNFIDLLGGATEAADAIRRIAAERTRQ